MFLYFPVVVVIGGGGSSSSSSSSSTSWLEHVVNFKNKCLLPLGPSDKLITVTSYDDEVDYFSSKIASCSAAIVELYG